MYDRKLVHYILRQVIDAIEKFKPVCFIYRVTGHFQLYSGIPCSGFQR